MEKDIIIIELAREVDLTIYTPICIVTKDYNLASNEAFIYGEILLSQLFLTTKSVLGWGKTSKTGSSSTGLVEKKIFTEKCHLAGDHVCANSNALELKEDLCLVRL